MSVGVTNLGTAPWAETARSGLMLGCRWLDADGAAVELGQGRAARIGDGRHAFRFTLPDHCLGGGRRTVEVRRAMDGATLIGTVRLPAEPAHP